ncbi:MAG: hypothetical protein U5M50_08730 [Sphingobium sp.]|nr:hypothetical protein [Sphingobium sp.]
MTSDADRFRRARTEFEQAMALGISIAALRDRQRHLRFLAKHYAAEAAADAITDLHPEPGDFSAWDCRHMMRD